MATFSTLKGVSNFADMDLSQLLAANFIMFLDWGFLDKGAFTNVKLNDANIYGADRTKLRLSSDEDYTDGQVWEIFHNNVVWESGLACPTQPINISGVYVNNTFHPLSGIGPYKHHIEYTTGRVVFDSPIPKTSVVKMEYSYKLISIVEARDYPALREIQFRSFDPYNNNFLQFASGDYNKSPNTRNQLPLIGVEVSPRLIQVPYELGNYIQQINTEIVFHVLAETDSMAKKIINILTMQKELTAYILNMDAIARSGEFPLTYNGSLSDSPQTYPQLAANPTYQYAKAYVSDAVGVDGEWVSNNLYHGQTRCTIETIH